MFSAYKLLRVSYHGVYTALDSGTLINGSHLYLRQKKNLFSISLAQSV